MRPAKIRPDTCRRACEVDVLRESSQLDRGPDLPLEAAASDEHQARVRQLTSHTREGPDECLVRLLRPEVRHTDDGRLDSPPWSGVRSTLPAVGDAGDPVVGTAIT